MTQGDAGTEQVRNVVLVGPGGAGKTLLVDAIALSTGAISRLGSVENGIRSAISRTSRSG